MIAAGLYGFAGEELEEARKRLRVLKREDVE